MINSNMGKIRYECPECKNDFLSEKRLDDKWHSRPQCGKCGNRKLKEEKKK